MRRKGLIFFLLFISSLSLAACTTAGEIEPTAVQSASTPEQSVIRALIDHLEGQGAPVGQMKLQVKTIAGEYAWVEVLSTDPSEPGGFNAFMKRENGAWTTVASGSGIEKGHVEALGIPQSVWPESWREPAP